MPIVPSKLDDDTKFFLSLMLERLRHAGPKIVSLKNASEWIIFTAYERADRTGGLGAGIFDSSGTCFGWFGIALSCDVCNLLGADLKEVTM